LKILIIIPAYNEEASLPGVIRDLQVHCPEADLLVVNDGSHDGTARVAADLGVKFLNLSFNLGIGGAMQAGYMYAEKKEYDVAVQFDGDGQHRAEEIKKLLQPIVNDRVDLVIGSRFLHSTDYKAPVMRLIGIRFFSLILSCILETPVTDTTSGFRAANKKIIEFFSRFYPQDYPEVEALVLVHKRGLRAAEVPVSMGERTGGSTSITVVQSVYYIVKVLLAVFIDLIKKAR
jgi:glycosyltransferase involved in cell wall biosynthesis